MTDEQKNEIYNLLAQIKVVERVLNSQNVHKKRLEIRELVDNIQMKILEL